MNHNKSSICHFQIYESCFGDEVVRQIRKEMLQACAKCQQIDSPQPPMPEEKPLEDEGQNPNAVYPNQQPTFDAGKLHQAILAFRPVS